MSSHVTRPVRRLVFIYNVIVETQNLSHDLVERKKSTINSIEYDVTAHNMASVSVCERL